MREPALVLEGDFIVHANGAARLLLDASAFASLVGRRVEPLLGAELLERARCETDSGRFLPGTLTAVQGARVQVELRMTALGDDLHLLQFGVAADGDHMLEQLALALEAVPHGIALADRHGRIMLVNAALERMFGHPRSALVGQPIERLLPERSRSAHAARFAQYMRDPIARVMAGNRSLAGLRADGTEVPIEIGLSAIATAQGHLAVASITDVSLRQRAEAMFERTVEAAPYGMLLADQDGVIRQVNAAIERQFGYSRTELVGQPLDQLLPARLRGAHAAHRQTYFAAPAVRSMGAERDLLAQRKDGSEFPVEIGLNPVRGDNGDVVLAAITDITTRKKLELELRQANADLEEFAYVASHDLKSPVRGIADLVEWIAEDLGEHANADVKHNLERVGTRVRRLERIIEDLLAYARAGRASSQVLAIDPKALLQEIVEVQNPPPGIVIATDVQAHAFTGARTPLETSLRNLVANAIKHHDRETGRIEIAAIEDERYCVFSVRDDGPGIPEKAQQRIFKMFQTLSKSEQNGSGIGLALTKRLVEAHGGRVTVASRDGVRGATFTIWWPRFAVRGEDA